MSAPGNTRNKQKSNPTSEVQEIFGVFLSHSHEDSKTVEVLGEKLEDIAKLRVWLDKWILVPGNHWQQEMARGLETAKTCAVCISSETPKGWFREEIERALNRQVNENSFRVIPVILPNGDRNIITKEFTGLRTWAEFTDDIDDGYAFHVLVAGILGRPPGRYNRPQVKASNFSLPQEQGIRDLEVIRYLIDKELIPLKVATGFQEKIVSQILRKSGHQS
jgi:hypothetical protein